MSEEKVFGIGLSKTGTTSLYAALNHLGYRAGTFGHMAKLGLHSWFENDFRKDYLKQYDALTDLPLAGFYKSLYDRYPNSKFILTVRDKSDWLRSCEKQFSDLPKKDFARKTNKFIYGTEKFDKEKFSAAYDTHLSEIPEFFCDKPLQFLVMDFFSGDDWDKLCVFLQKDVPNITFPNVKPGFRVAKDPLRIRYKVLNVFKKILGF